MHRAKFRYSGSFNRLRLIHEQGSAILRIMHGRRLLCPARFGKLIGAGWP
jgi:hypothetical protein